MAMLVIRSKSNLPLIFVFSGCALFYVAIARNKGYESPLILVQVFAYRWQGTMNLRFHQLSLPHLIILATIWIFKEKGNIQGVHLLNTYTIMIHFRNFAFANFSRTIHFEIFGFAFATNTIFFLGVGVRGIWGCATVLVTVPYIVLQNISTGTEYYTVRTSSFSASSSQGLASHEHSVKISEKQ